MIKEDFLSWSFLTRFILSGESKVHKSPHGFQSGPQTRRMLSGASNRLEL